MTPLTFLGWIIKVPPLFREMQAKKYGSSLWDSHTHFGVNCKIMRKV